MELLAKQGPRPRGLPTYWPAPPTARWLSINSLPICRLISSSIASELHPTLIVQTGMVRLPGGKRWPGRERLTVKWQKVLVESYVAIWHTSQHDSICVSERWWAHLNSSAFSDICMYLSSCCTHSYHSKQENIARVQCLTSWSTQTTKNIKLYTKVLTELLKYIYKRQHLLLLLSAVDLSRKIMRQGDRTNENRCPMIPHIMQCSHLCSGDDMKILKLIIINSSG